VYRINVAQEEKFTCPAAEKRTTGKTPIWLNSFLSLFVPSCYVSTVNPAVFTFDEINSEEDKKEMKELQANFSEEKRHSSEK
jgi:hypothetical protein